MNRGLFFVALAMMVAVATSSQCSVQCFGVCNIAKTDCDGALVLGPICDLAYGQCAAGCSTVCACDDACDGQCQPNYADCNAQAGDNPILLLECSAQYDVCIVNCEATCTVQTAMATLGMVMGGGAAQ